jgi:ferredoxin-NADP reductase
VVFGLVAYYRALRPLYLFAKHRFAVERVEQEAADVYSVYITGRGIGAFAYQPGQYAAWWIMARGLWWQAHPFSFSSRPGQGTMRFTVKAKGDFTAKLPSVAPGTPVIIDGPRGSFIGSRVLSGKVLLIAGGIGITPYLSAIERLLAQGKEVTLLYAVRQRQNFAFAPELRALQRKGLRLEVYVSERSQAIDRGVLARFAPADTTVFICGPDRMLHGITGMLRQLGFNKDAIITERFAF